MPGALGWNGGAAAGGASELGADGEGVLGAVMSVAAGLGAASAKRTSSKFQRAGSRA